MTSRADSTAACLALVKNDTVYYHSCSENYQDNEITEGEMQRARLAGVDIVINRNYYCS